MPFKIVHPPSSAVAAAKNCEAILNRVRVEPKPPKLVVLDLSAAPIIDMQSAHMLAGMVDELTDQGIQFHAVEPRSSVRDRLRREGVDIKLGGIDRFTTVADVIDHFLGESAPQQPQLNLRSRCPLKVTPLSGQDSMGCLDRILH